MTETRAKLIENAKRTGALRRAVRRLRNAAEGKRTLGLKVNAAVDTEILEELLRELEKEGDGLVVAAENERAHP